MVWGRSAALDTLEVNVSPCKNCIGAAGLMLDRLRHFVNETDNALEERKAG